MTDIEFEALKIRRATDLIETRISDMIIKGKIHPGEKLPTEKALSEQFNVSVVTVREALRGLEVAGFINKKRGKGGGIYVTETNSDSVRLALTNFLKRKAFSARHLAEVRATIEPTIIRMAVARLERTELETLKSNVSFCETKLDEADDPLPLDVYSEIGYKNLDFHRLIAQATRNPVFALTIDYLMDFIHEFRKSVFTPNRNHWQRVIHEHRAIVTAMENGDAAGAEAEMTAHVKYIDIYQEDESIDFMD